jgi:hypothetical protein
MSDLGRHYLDNVINEFRLLKKQGERAMAQLADAVLESRKQADMAEAIAQRTLLSLAVTARRRE